MGYCFAGLPYRLWRQHMLRLHCCLYIPAKPQCSCTSRFGILEIQVPDFLQLFKNNVPIPEFLRMAIMTNSLFKSPACHQYTTAAHLENSGRGILRTAPGDKFQFIHIRPHLLHHRTSGTVPQCLHPIYRHQMGGI
jgi:hypothetical protein